MSQFVAYRNDNPATNHRYPYLLDIQSDLLSELKTTVVIPLSPTGVALAKHFSRLNPFFTIEGANVIALTQDIAGISRTMLGAQVCDLSEYRSEIIDAVDFVLSGI
ncbi:plasmid maintenance protein CcdB [Rheinheimera riviphila]|uniref:Toxin CcdB n=1 Tax=Rheinheimera riviphila TaxID=1834037 RepID=A0A437QIG2_9GAMM|nr:CcdB family protein [Rheinheimera riviphila]RVU34319.1 plasmid maintenance protein CcdB [Rheinheimera riviphila]